MFSILLAFIITFGFVSAPSISKEKNVENGKKWVYTGSKTSYPRVEVDAEDYERAIQDLRKISSYFLYKEEFDELVLEIKENAKRGICYGSAVSFLISNGPQVKKIHIPSSKKEKANIVFFQTSQVVVDLMKKKGKTFNKQFPWQLLFEEIFCEQRKQLSKVGLCPANELPIILERKKLNDEDFAKLFCDELGKLIKEKHAMDFIFCFYRSKLPHHAILAQFEQMRIYDSEFGIYEYEKIRDLGCDLSKHLSSQLGRKGVIILAYSPKQ